MYEKICVRLDGSASSRGAVKLASRLGAAFGADVEGIEVDEDAAQEATLARLRELLPPSYRPETQATPTASAQGAHADLRAWASDIVRSAGLAFSHRRSQGRPTEALSHGITTAGGDLVVLGAMADGEPAGSQVGAQCERFLRRTHIDTVVVKQAGPELDERDTILVCVDGSHQSYAGLQMALQLGKKFDKRVEAVGVYDPYLHYTLFNGIVSVLSKKAEAVFKFKDQEKLHEEIIDTGLAKIYQAHLEVAREVAREHDAELKITLLDGKAFRKILQQVRKRPPWLLVMGRIGVHSGADMDVGATTENLVRCVPCNVLVSSRTYVPSVDKQAEASVEWTPEALKKMERVPSFVKGVATNAIVRWAMERGHSIITASVINSAMGDLLPPDAAQAMGYVAEELAIKTDNLVEGKTFICPECGYAAKDFRPVACAICKTEGAKFDQIDRAALQSIGKLDKGAVDDHEEKTFDGHKLKWAPGAMPVLHKVPSGYERRRAKARIEKTARVRGLDRITAEFVREMVQQDLADNSYLSDRGEALKVEFAAEERGDDTQGRAREGSTLQWTDAAWKRMCRVPEGFMRDMTRERVEGHATGTGATVIDLELCEAGIAEGRRMMAEMLMNYQKPNA